MNQQAVAVPARRAVIQQRLLGDEVFERLLSDIVAGRVAVHERLNVDVLAFELGVSRTPVREALTRLSWIGLVDIARNSHTLVAEWTERDMHDRLIVIGNLAGLALQCPKLELMAVASAWDPAAPIDAPIQTYLDLVGIIAERTERRTLTTLLHQLLPALRVFFDPASPSTRVIQPPAGAAILLDLQKALESADPASAASASHRFVEETVQVNSPST